ncbi:MAG TPA: hypothetical protein PLI09_15880 [Candidatus Hydrogenedentes bacterium]|nr:hypothetical protein [Candidatus Hydrogenedentota bacterium]
MQLDHKTFRRCAGTVFLIGNITALLTNLVDTNWYQLWSGLLFVTCSISLILSSHHHRWLFYCGISTFFACMLIAVSSPGDGQILTYLSGLAGFTGAFLTLRAAFQRETHKQYKLPATLSLIDKYPMAASGIIEGTCFFITTIGALINSDYRLAIVSFIYVAGYGCLILSDEYFRKALSLRHS